MRAPLSPDRSMAFVTDSSHEAGRGGSARSTEESRVDGAGRFVMLGVEAIWRR